MLQPDTLLNNRYRILAQIGEGGMATVYRALDTRLGRTVAIKVLHHQFGRDEPFLQRFQQEAEFAASLGAHPNIVAIYDIGQDDPYHYIVMELVEGRSLKDMIRERAPFDVPEAFGIGRQVASALDFAHKRGLVHRDVKPQNIMVSSDGVAKVTDFGIARSMTASQLTRTGMVIGTVHYFSPEQAQGKPADARSDIYSLGVILYEMLTRHLPFDAENAIGVAMQHVHSDPPPLQGYNSTIPSRAAATVMRALEKDPDHRYRDAAEFASALADQSTGDVGVTTLFNPVAALPLRQQTAVYDAVETSPRPERAEPAARETRSGRARPIERPREPNPWRTAWITLAAVLALLAVGLGAFFVTKNALGGSAAATSTPTSTPKPTPKPAHHRPTPRPTAIPTAPVVVPTFTPVPPTSPPPTFTPVPPTPKPTPTPRPAPTPTPKPAPTSTPEPLLPTVLSTPVG